MNIRVFLSWGTNWLIANLHRFTDGSFLIACCLLKEESLAKNERSENMKFLTGRTRALPRTLGTLVQSDSKVRLPKENIKAAGPYFEGRRSRREISTSSANLFNRSHNSWDLKRFLEEVRKPKIQENWPTNTTFEHGCYCRILLKLKKYTSFFIS